MKKLIIVAALLVSGACYSQTKYYFFNIQASGGKGIQVMTEKDMAYPDIDTLIVQSREGKKVSYKFFPTNTAAYNTLAAAGLEFVQFIGESSILGSATLWKRKE